jgi:hypothetical protein
MSADLTFRCPACRARQTLREQCRRCKADLGLVARAHRRVAYLVNEQHQARLCGERERERIISAELLWLAPACNDRA